MTRGLSCALLVLSIGCGDGGSTAADGSAGGSGPGSGGASVGGASSGGASSGGAAGASSGGASTGGVGGGVSCEAPEPSVSGVSGTLAHGATITISGCGFGSKPTAAPVVWDDASGSDPNDKWDFVYPYQNDDAFRLAYRAPLDVTKQSGKGGVPLPHSHVQKYLAGAHYNSGALDAHSGWDVCAGKNGQENQKYTYISYYRTIDPDWHATSPNPNENDHNFKEYDYAAGDGYMGDGPNIYLGNGSGENPLGASLVWGGNYIEGMQAEITSVNETFMNWYPEYDTVFSSASVPSVGKGWQKVELLLVHDSADGFHRVFQDNQLVWDISLDDDGLPAGARSETVIGGYAREASNADAYKNNWRYYADVYYDHSFARVMLANAASYDQATIIEPQIPNGWSSGAVGVSVNLGRLPAGTTAYVFVFDSNGNRNVTGFPVQL